MKLLLPFLFLSGLLQAQWFGVSDYTLSLNRAPNCSIDSSVVIGNGTILQERIKYTYDSKRRLVLKNRHDIQSNDTEISTFNYDVNDSLVRKTYTDDQSTPTLTALTVMTRNPLKQLAYDTLSYKSGSQYTLNTASSYSYDAGGNVSEREMHFYNTSWAPLNRSQWTRNSAGKVTNTLFQGWVNGAWENSNQGNYTYNSNNNVTDVVGQQWNSTSSSWVNSFRDRWAYTGSHIDTLTSYSWNNAWINVSRSTYGSAGAIDSVTLDYWNAPQWESSKRFVRTWAQGKLASVVEKSYGTTWENAWKREYLYDAKGNHIVTNLYIYFIGATSDWVLLIVTNHYYSCSTVGITENTLNDTKTYPVPSSGMLYFDSALPVMSGMVYATNGLEAIRFEGSAVDLSTVMPGVYYVKLLLEDGNFRVVKAIRE